MAKIEDYSSDDNSSDAGPSVKKEPPSSSCGNLKSHFVGMGFSPTLVEKAIADNDSGRNDADLLLETLLTYSDGERMPSNPDFFAPSKEPAKKPEFTAAKRELTPFEFLELLRKQEPEKIQFSSTLGAAADGNCSHTSSRIQNVYKNKQDDRSIAIDEYGITSAVDYGTRDYYYPSSHTSDVPYKALQTSSPASADSLGSFSSFENDDSPIDFSKDDVDDIKELGGHTTFDLNKKSQLLSMTFSEEEVNSAINQLGENADLDELIDIIVAAQNAGCSVEDNIDGCDNGHDGINKESAAETLFGTMDKTLSLLKMGFTDTEVSRAIDNFGTDVPIWKLADSIHAGQREKSFHDSYRMNLHNRSRCARDPGCSDFSEGTFQDFEDEKISKKAKCMPVVDKTASSSSFRKQTWVERVGKHSVCDELKYSKYADLVKEEIADQFMPNIPRSIHGSVTRSPFFFYGNVVDVPKEISCKMSTFLRGTDPEYVNSQFFSAFIRKEGYFHNLPTENRFRVHPQPPMIIEAALPHIKRWWPSWDTRKQLSSISSDTTGVDQLCERLGRMMTDSRGLLSTEQQMDILHNCKKVNLMWVGHYKLRPIQPGELECILGYPAEHTQIYSSDPSDRLWALKYCFQTDTLGYHLSVLKDKFPDGLRLLSVYSGIGGAEIALHKLGIHLKLVVSFEVCEKNREILRRWWDSSGQSGELRQIGNIEKMSTQRIESYIKQFGGFDLIVGVNPGSNVARTSSTDNLVGTDMNQFFHFVRVFRAFQGM